MGWCCWPSRPILSAGVNAARKCLSRSSGEVAGKQKSHWRLRASTMDRPRPLSSSRSAARGTGAWRTPSQTSTATLVPLPSSHTRTGGSRRSRVNSLVAPTALVIISLATSSTTSIRWPSPHSGSRSRITPRAVRGALAYAPSSRKSRWYQSVSQPSESRPGVTGCGGTTGMDVNADGMEGFTDVPFDVGNRHGEIGIPRNRAGHPEGMPFLAENRMRDPCFRRCHSPGGYAIHTRARSLSFGCLRRFSMTLSSSTPEPETTPRGKLAKHLRLIRQAAGFTTQTPLATRLGVSTDLISKMETGKHVPTQDIFLALLDICGVSEEARVYLTDLWFLARASSGGVREFFEKYATAEAKAAFLRLWGLLLIPGPLQTRAYAHAMFLKGGLDEDEATEQA